ncbi:MAG: DAK2 domain-containing protein [Anaerofustis stercorihominis]|nr:DAK2 domain-containing protein [Anaerofustis stercorihominis]
MQKEISSALFVRAIKSGYANLENSKNEVNNLNVFPVPDGDTGTNMALTMQNAKEELLKQTPATVGECAVNASTGALMGARGNSGVILSQLFRGFSKSLAGKDVITVEALANAFLAASNMAYKAVMKPTEGTILTVARVMGEFASENHSKYEDIVSFGEDILKAGNEALADTPNLLPVLKQAGVVDAGGKGLLCILEGALKAIKGEDIELSGVTTETESSVEAGEIDADITFAYCTEFLIRAKDDGDYERWLTEKLFKLGDCLIVIQDGKIIKVHVHTNEPWTAMKHASQCGELEKIKIENMRRQHSEMFGETKSPEEPKTEEYNTEHVKYATIAVCAGDGFEEILRQLGVDYIIKGGQTMNPSTEDFLKIINNTDAEHYILLPNNKNIIMAASQTKSISDKDITVIETRNLPQAISAMISFDVEAELEGNVEAMNEAKGSVKTGQVTFAVRNTNVDGFEISEGDIIGVLSDEIVVCEKDVKTAIIGLIDKMVDEDSELISVYYGEDVTEEEAQELVEELAEKYEDCDIELSEGSQPLYYYIIGVE